MSSTPPWVSRRISRLTEQQKQEFECAHASINMKYFIHLYAFASLSLHSTSYEQLWKPSDHRCFQSSGHAIQTKIERSSISRYSTWSFVLTTETLCILCPHPFLKRTEDRFHNRNFKDSLRNKRFFNRKLINSFVLLQSSSRLKDGTKLYIFSIDSRYTRRKHFTAGLWDYENYLLSFNSLHLSNVASSEIVYISINNREYFSKYLLLSK